LFGFFAACALIFPITKVSETRNHSLKEIEQQLAARPAQRRGGGGLTR
jgi:hypothetical protein